MLALERGTNKQMEQMTTRGENKRWRNFSRDRIKRDGGRVRALCVTVRICGRYANTAGMRQSWTYQVTRNRRVSHISSYERVSMRYTHPSFGRIVDRETVCDTRKGREIGVSHSCGNFFSRENLKR